MMLERFRKIPAQSLVILTLLGCALLVRVAWYLSTHYIVDDAYITFRFASQLASGHGFVFNTGEPIYGTTTPFFALILAGWRLLTGIEIPIGAVILNLAAALTTLVFVWLALRNLEISTAQHLYVIGLLAFCYRGIVAETKGLETAWVVCFMAASWWAASAGRATLAGIFCGLLLWTRPDTFFWPMALTVGTGKFGLRRNMRLLLTCALTYLPWFVFASWYFGSPIPQTITAKWVAYVQFNASPVTEQAQMVLYSLAPLSLPLTSGEINMMTIPTALLCVWQALRSPKNPWLAVLPVFIVLDAVRLIITKATFSTHYIYPALWATLILFGLGLGALHNTLATKGRAFAVLFCIIPLLLFTENATILNENIRAARQEQSVWHEAALMQMGKWLNQHTAPNTTILLEPLGYVGYYANRRIIDEVGLISPRTVEMKRKQINDVYQYLLAYHPDYIITPCNEAAAWVERSKNGEISFANNFTLAATFNPKAPEPNLPANNICYQIWQQR